MVKVDDRVKMIFVDNKVLTGVVKEITETSYRVFLDNSLINGNIRNKEFIFDKGELYAINKI